MKRAAFSASIMEIKDDDEEEEEDNSGAAQNKAKGAPTVQGKKQKKEAHKGAP